MICQEGLTQKGFFFSPGCTSILWQSLFLPVAKQRKKCVDELFRTGSVSHALLVVSQVPYSQHASCTKLGNTPPFGFAIHKSRSHLEEVVLKNLMWCFVV